MTKYHISKKTGSPAVCKAEPGNCPLGAASEHFVSKVEAQQAAEKKNAAKFGLFANMKSGVTGHANANNLQSSGAATAKPQKTTSQATHAPEKASEANSGPSAVQSEFSRDRDVQRFEQTYFEINRVYHKQKEVERMYQGQVATEELDAARVLLAREEVRLSKELTKIVSRFNNPQFSAAYAH